MIFQDDDFSKRVLAEAVITKQKAEFMYGSTLLPNQPFFMMHKKHQQTSTKLQQGIAAQVIGHFYGANDEKEGIFFKERGHVS